VIAVSILFLVSALGAMNGSILTGSRVPYALAKDRLFPAALASLSVRHVPVYAVLAQAAVAITLALMGTFDQLTDAVVFASWIFYGLCTGAVFILRRRLRERGEHPPYRTPFYPVLPVVFIAVTGVLLVYTIVSMPVLTLLGLGIIAVGVPVFLFVRRRIGRAP
jgi:APA family basic amino acid/polyamine antiporter